MADACRAGLDGGRADHGSGHLHRGAGPARPGRVRAPGAGARRLRLGGVRAAGPAARPPDGPAALPDRPGRHLRPGALHLHAVHGGPLPRLAAGLDRGAVDQHLVLRARHQPGRHGLAAGLPGGTAAVAAVPACAVGGAGVHPAVGGRLRLRPPEPGPAVPPPAQPVRAPPARAAVGHLPGPVDRVRARRRGGRRGERVAALAPGGPGGTPADQVVPGRAAGHGRLPHRDAGLPGHAEPGPGRCRPAS